MAVGFLGNDEVGIFPFFKGSCFPVDTERHCRIAADHVDGLMEWEELKVGQLECRMEQRHGGIVGTQDMPQPQSNGIPCT